MKLYVAYGSNLDKEQMKYRCPSARPVQSGYLDNWQLIYRGARPGRTHLYVTKKDAVFPLDYGKLPSMTKGSLIGMRVSDLLPEEKYICPPRRWFKG